MIEVVSSLFVVAALRAAADDLDLVGLHCLCSVVHLESDILDEECPDFVAEPVGVKRSLMGGEPVSITSLRMDNGSVSPKKDRAPTWERGEEGKWWCDEGKLP